MTDANWSELSSVTETIERLERELRRCVGFTAYRDQLERELEGVKQQRKAALIAALCDDVRLDMTNAPT